MNERIQFPEENGRGIPLVDLRGPGSVLSALGHLIQEIADLNGTDAVLPEG